MTNAALARPAVNGRAAVVAGYGLRSSIHPAPRGARGSWRVLAILIGLLLLVAAPARADMTPTPPPSGLPTAAEQHYVAGVAATRAKEWSGAAAAFRRAVELKPAYAEAWNGLGYALRNQGKYAESLEAYGEALRIRPDYPDALEYLGEAYVKMGRLDDARRVLERLKPLDRERARELSEAIGRRK